MADSASNDQNATDQKAPKAWKCGDDYQYPLPEPDGDPWNNLLKPLLENDKVKCDAWTDEVQNLLIFAGLFSAVVTSFAVATFPDLQEDPVVALLTQIAANSATNGSAGLPQPFAPAASTIRLNVFLFLSLILSLTTVLVGIVALQWIREHRQLSNTLTPQNMFATLHMRTEALHKWHVPQIFAALPLLLQSALIFFFAGMVQLLVDASTVVLIPVACVIGLTILFLILTTILPTAQAVTLSFSGLRLNDEIPVPCPYKSPQAKAFRRLVTSSETLFRTTSCIFAALYWVAFFLLVLPQHIASFSYCAIAIRLVRNFFNRTLYGVSKLMGALSLPMSPLTRSLPAAGSLKSWHAFDYMKSNIFYYWRLHSWLEFDLAWMSIRDNYFRSICPSDSWLFLTREENREYAALYDATQGFCEELSKDNFNVNVNPEPAIITAYHCALSLCFPSISHVDPDDYAAVEALFTRNQYLATLLGSEGTSPLRVFSKTLKPSDFQVLWEETSFIFLYSIQEQLKNTGRSSSTLTNHFAEVYLRLLSQLYSKPYEMDDNPHAGRVPDVVFEGEDLYVMKIYDALNQPFTYQWALSITSFFNVLADPSTPYSQIARSFHAHPFFRGYCANFWRQLKYEIHTETVHQDTIQVIIITLSLIRQTLDKFLENSKLGEEDATFPRSQFVLQSAAIYLWYFRYRRIDHHALVPAAEDTLLRVKDLKRLLPLTSDATIDVADDAPPWFTNEWWNELFSASQGGPPDGSVATTTQASDAHGGRTDDERWTLGPSPHLPDNITFSPTWPEPQFYGTSTIGSRPSDFPSSSQDWQLQVIDPTDNIV